MEESRKRKSSANVCIVCGQGRNDMEGTFVLELWGGKPLVELNQIITVLFHPFQNPAR